MINDNGMLKRSPTIIYNLSWTAIFIGTSIGFGLSFLLDLFGLALGLSLFSTTNTGATLIAFGGMVGILIGLVTTMLAAGYVTGYLGRSPNAQQRLGIFYGLTTWSLILILNVLLASSLNLYISNVMSITYLPSPAVINSPRVIAESAFIMFSLFLVGAFSTCIGAYWAMGSKQPDSVIDIA
jgi:hypothetical protein